MYNFLFSIFDKFKYYIILGGTAVVWFLFYIFKIKRQAKQEVINDINKETQKVKDEWSKIDDSDVSYRDAIDGLRKHSRKGGKS